jgi:hypothetical protein
MPCRSGYEDEPRKEIIYQDNPAHLNRINELEAAVCALCNELEDMGYLDDVMAAAEKNGMTNIRKIWEQHQQEDLARMKKNLSLFSEHEIKLIKQILNIK